MFNLPKTATEVIAILLCLLIVAAFIKAYLFV